MLAESFENSARQQQRRMERQLAMQRMEEAAGGDGAIAGIMDGCAVDGAVVGDWEKHGTRRRGGGHDDTGGGGGNASSLFASSSAPANKGAKNFLWEVASDRSVDSSSVASRNVNLHDMARTGGSTGAEGTPSDAAGVGFFDVWGIWNAALSAYGMGNGIGDASVGGESHDGSSGSGYRDEEGASLLAAANARLSSPAGLASSDQANDVDSPMWLQESSAAAPSSRQEFRGGYAQRRERLMAELFADRSGGRCCATDPRGRRKGGTAFKAAAIILVAVVVVAVSSAAVMRKVLPDNNNGGGDAANDAEHAGGNGDAEHAKGDGDSLFEPKNEIDPSIDRFRYESIKDRILEDGALSSASYLEDEDSAQRKALTWIVRDDERKLTARDPYIGQRYGLAVLWFSSTGRAEEDDGDGGPHGGGRKRMLKSSRELSPTTPSPDVDAAATATIEWDRHSNWLSSAGICHWEGVRCHVRADDSEEGGVNDDRDGDVRYLELANNNLAGEISNDVFWAMPYLTHVDLSGNRLTGTISSAVGHLTVLEHLDLSGNNLGGSVPFGMAMAKNLQTLRLADNSLGGSVPHSIGNLKRLRELDLSRNGILGALPPELGALTELTSLRLGSNLFQGSIPDTIVHLKNLMFLDISHNKLDGPIPSAIGGMKYLQSLRLGSNRFTGSVPTEFAMLEHLEELLLSDNGLKGELLWEFRYLNKLSQLDLANNHLSGSIPVQWSNMVDLELLSLTGNEIRGSIPTTIDGMNNLREVYFGYNDITGLIPTEMGRMFKLEKVHLQNNELRGSVPVEIGELTKIKELRLHNNNLTGVVPRPVCKLAKEMFLSELSIDCAGENPEVFCDCCSCNMHENIVDVEGLTHKSMATSEP